MKRRERVMNSLNFKPVDRMPKDLSGMASTGISCFAYRDLIDYLGLEDRPIKVWDTGQMLALPDLDVLDILDCDVVMTNGVITNAFEQDELWKPYTFDDRLKSGHVLKPENFSTNEEGTIVQKQGTSISTMPKSAVVFNTEHAGQPFDLDDDFTFKDLAKMRKDLEEFEVSDEEVERLVKHCKKVRESTDRAVMFDGLQIGFGFDGGMVQGTMKCILEPEYVDELNSIYCEFAKKKYKKIVPAIAPYVDIILIAAEDLGSQNQLFIPTDTCRDLYFKYFKEINDIVHMYAPEVKTFLHSCGAIYDIIDIIIDAGFDILNPVQWSAGGHSYKEWKDKARNKISLWGGAVNAQHTLPLKTIPEIEEEAIKVAKCFIEDTGVMFNNCHNILAEITPDKVVALYDTPNKI